MPLVSGLAVSYSPLLYRARESWAGVRDVLVGDVVQPAEAAAETPERLDAIARELGDAWQRSAERCAASALDALVVLVADTNRYFDETQTPQLHVYAGDAMWGDPACAELNEAPAPHSVTCDRELGEFVAEELTRDGFDVVESRNVFRPLGDPARGVVPALVEPLRRLGITVPVVPIHLNCHVAPAISGHRMPPFGHALARALARVPARVGLLASGGLSGQPGDKMAGWIDDVLDRWVLRELTMGRAESLSRMFDVASDTLRGSSREIRLWIAAAAALQHAGLRAHLDWYVPLHHAACGVAFMNWRA